MTPRNDSARPPLATPPQARPRRLRLSRTMRRRIAAYAQTRDNDAVPTDMDAFRFELARRLHQAIGNATGCWRSCRERICRRRRGCMTPDFRCAHAPEPGPASPEDLARTQALVRQALEAADNAPQRESR